MRRKRESRRAGRPPAASGSALRGGIALAALLLFAAPRWGGPARGQESSDAEAQAIVHKYKARLGDDYEYVVDAKNRIVTVHNLKRAVYRYAEDGLRKILCFNRKAFFKCPHDYYITILMPHDQKEFASRTGRQGTDAGYYRPSDKTLTLDIYTGSGSMIHEFTHAMHFADQGALGQSHPLWIIEGFGSLYEEAIPNETNTVGLLNWRLPILQKALDEHKCFPLRQFVSDVNAACFQKNTALAYAMTRYLFYYLQEKKLLQKWYAQYRKDYTNDKSGMKTLEKVCRKGVDALEKEWIRYVKALKYEGSREGKQYLLGLAAEIAEDGIFIMRVQDASPIAKSGIEVGDLLMKVDGRKIETREDMKELVKKHKNGDHLTLTVKRIDEVKDFTVTVEGID